MAKKSLKRVHSEQEQLAIAPPQKRKKISDAEDSIARLETLTAEWQQLFERKQKIKEIDPLALSKNQKKRQKTK